MAHVVRSKQTFNIVITGNQGRNVGLKSGGTNSWEDIMASLGT